MTETPRSGLRHGARRAWNALRRVRRGLPPAGAAVSPEVPNDLFQAHLSLYLFCSEWARGKSVLDLGCGTGYGSARLLADGAEAVAGIDPAARSVASARRGFGRGVAFHAGTLAPLPADLGTFDLEVAIDALPRTKDPGAALADWKRHLEPGGALVASLPPILDGQTLALHQRLQRRPGERSHLYLWDWQSLLGEHFRTLRLFRHLPPAGPLPDFADPWPSRLDPAAFRFEELPPAEIYDVGSLTAIFVCKDPA